MRPMVWVLALAGCNAEGELGASAAQIADLEAEVAALKATTEALQAELDVVEETHPTFDEMDAAIDAAVPEGALATEAWVDAGYARKGDADAAIAAAVEAGSLATPADVTDGIAAAVADDTVATPGDVDAAIAAADLATAGDVDAAIAAAVTGGQLATPADVTDGIAAAVSDGTVASQAWVGDTYVARSQVGTGLSFDGDFLDVDPSELASSAAMVTELTNLLDDYYLSVDGDLGHDLLLDAAVRLAGTTATCETASDHGKLRYQGGAFAGCTEDGWVLLGGGADGSSPANAGTSCLQILADHIDSQTGPYWLRGSGGTYQAWCDMETDGGGWTLLGTISGGDANRWNHQLGPWSDTTVIGSTQAPWNDHKSQAWYDLDVTGGEVLYQRRYDGVVRARAVFGPSCLFGNSRFSGLFEDYDTTLRCPSDAITVIEPAVDGTGLADPTYAEGSSGGIGGSGSAGVCWNGGDTNNNTFKGHLYWTVSGESCLGASHYGGIAVYSHGHSQFTDADITATNWLNGTDYTRTAISFFVR